MRLIKELLNGEIFAYTQNCVKSGIREQFINNSSGKILF
jgi:hypothetical protein